MVPLAADENLRLPLQMLPSFPSQERDMHNCLVSARNEPPLRLLDVGKYVQTGQSRPAESRFVHHLLQLLIQRDLVLKGLGILGLRLHKHPSSSRELQHLRPWLLPHSTTIPSQQSLFRGLHELLSHLFYELAILDVRTFRNRQIPVFRLDLGHHGAHLLGGPSHW